MACCRNDNESLPGVHFPLSHTPITQSYKRLSLKAVNIPSGPIVIVSKEHFSQSFRGDHEYREKAFSSASGHGGLHTKVISRRHVHLSMANWTSAQKNTFPCLGWPFTAVMGPGLCRQTEGKRMHSRRGRLALRLVLADGVWTGASIHSSLLIPCCPGNQPHPVSSICLQ